MSSNARAHVHLWNRTNISATFVDAAADCRLVGLLRTATELHLDDCRARKDYAAPCSGNALR
eukprot:4331516-Pleurochrysis_carterae.AAC.2